MKYTAIIAMLFFTAVLCADEPREKPQVDTLSTDRILFLGNSITLHRPAPQIGWTGNWGMAASAAEKDYAHLLTARLTQVTGSEPQTMVKNIAAFERGYSSFDIAKELERELKFEADIVIVAIGENVTEPKTDEAKEQFALAFASLLEQIEQHGSPTIFVRSSFWASETKDTIMREVSANVRATFVDMAALGRDPSHAVRAERKIDHAGVASHPGDKGMTAIADALFQAIHNRRMSRVQQE